jgi:hypothetical protein
MRLASSKGLAGACTWAAGPCLAGNDGPQDRRGELLGTALGAAVGGAFFCPAVGGGNIPLCAAARPAQAREPDRFAEPRDRAEICAGHREASTPGLPGDTSHRKHSGPFSGSRSIRDCLNE